MWNKKKKKTIEETSVKTSKRWFADALKSNIVIPNKNKQTRLLLNKEENVVKTKEDLNKKANPLNFKNFNVEKKKRKNGSVGIQSEGNE